MQSHLQIEEYVAGQDDDAGVGQDVEDAEPGPERYLDGQISLYVSVSKIRLAKNYEEAPTGLITVYVVALNSK